MYSVVEGLSAFQMGPAGAWPHLVVPVLARMFTGSTAPTPGRMHPHNVSTGAGAAHSANSDGDMKFLIGKLPIQIFL